MSGLKSTATESSRKSSRSQMVRRVESIWGFQTFFIFTPKIGEDEPILTSIFFQMAVKPPTSEGIDFGKQHLKVFFESFGQVFSWMPEKNRMGESDGFFYLFFFPGVVVLGEFAFSGC